MTTRLKPPLSLNCLASLLDLALISTGDIFGVSSIKISSSLSFADCIAIFSHCANEVFPILGLPAITIKSSSCSPCVIPSTALKPDDRPINSPCFFASSSSLSKVWPTYSSIFFKESVFDLFSESSKILVSASFKRSSLVFPLGSLAVFNNSFKTFLRFLSTDCSLTEFA